MDPDPAPDPDFFGFRTRVRKLGSGTPYSEYYGILRNILNNKNKPIYMNIHRFMNI